MKCGKSKSMKEFESRKERFLLGKSKQKPLNSAQLPLDSVTPQGQTE